MANWLSYERCSRPLNKKIYLVPYSWVTISYIHLYGQDISFKASPGYHGNHQKIIYLWGTIWSIRSHAYILVIPIDGHINLKTTSRRNYTCEHRKFPIEHSLGILGVQYRPNQPTNILHICQEIWIDLPCPNVFLYGWCWHLVMNWSILIVEWQPQPIFTDGDYLGCLESHFI